MPEKATKEDLLNSQEEFTAMDIAEILSEEEIAFIMEEWQKYYSIKNNWPAK